MNQAIKDAINRYNHEGDKGLDWIYFICWSAKDKESLDAHLVTIKHPLAYLPGTNESRFKAYIKEIAKEASK